MQGLIGGEFGDLGIATLTDRQVSDLLALVMKDVEKVMKSDLSSDARNRTQAKLGGQARWRSLDTRQRRHLQLGARLMACAQRRYFDREEWGHFEDPAEMLENNYLKIKGTGENEWVDPAKEDPVCPIEIVVESPWMKHVTRILCHGMSLHSRKGAFETHKKRFPRDSPADPSVQINLAAEFPVLEELAKNVSSQSKPALLSILPLVCGCVECFPAGGCWTSSTFKYWKQLPPTDSNSQGVDYYQGCGPADLGLIIYLLGNLLHEHGSSSADLAIQNWILFTLVRLTETSSLLYQTYSEEPSLLRSLGEVWRRIWEVLFRNDYRYSACTENDSLDTSGGLVLILLREMVQRGCTDPLLSIPGVLTNKKMSFIHKNQWQVWSLPVFHDFNSTSSSLPFELTCSMLQVAGLSDVGVDRIDSTLGAKFYEYEHIPSTSHDCGSRSGRRMRLTSFALSCLERWVKSRTIPDSEIAVVLACIISLVNGKIPQYRRDNLSSEPRFRAMTGLGDSTFGLPMTGSADLPELDVSFNTCQEACFGSLWSCRDGSCVGAQTCERYQDSVDVIATRLRIRRFMPLDNADFVSDPESEDLRRFSITFIEKRIYSLQGQAKLSDSPGSNDAASTSSEGDMDPQRLSCQTLAVRCLICLKVFCSDSTLQNELKGVLLGTAPFVGKACSRLKKIADAREFLHVSSDLLRIASGLAVISSYCSSGLQMNGLVESKAACKSMLKIYLRRTRRRNDQLMASSTSSSNDAKGSDFYAVEDFLDDDNDDDEHFPSQRKSTSKQQSLESLSEGDDYHAPKRGLAPSQQHGVKRRRLAVSNDTLVLPLNHECAKRVGSLLFVLDPSPSSCQLICEALLGTELDLDPSTVQGDMDLRSVVFCTKLLGGEAAFWHSRFTESDRTNAALSSTHSSSVVNLCRVVELTRSCAGPNTSLYGFGSDICAKMVCVAADDTSTSETGLSESEAQYLVEILKDTNGIQSRPYLRAKRMYSATAAFEAGSSNFRELFRKSYVKGVQSALGDSNAAVRRSGAIATGVALRFLDERKIVQAVSKLTAPIARSGNDGSGTQGFASWYREMGFFSLADDDLITKRETDDATLGMECEAIFSKSIIAASLQSNTLFQEVLHEIISISFSRPDLEFVCFQALERIAIVKHYKTVEEMIELQSEVLLKLWLQTNELEFPLTLTAPSILRRLVMRSSCPTNESCNGSEDTPAFDVARVRKEASWNFLARYRHFLVPMALIQIVKSTPSLSSQKEDNLQLLKSDAKIQMIYSMTFEGEDFIKGIETILKHHVADIVGFCKPMLKSEDEGLRNVGANVDCLLNSVLSSQVVVERMNKKWHKAFHRILKVFGKSKCLDDIVPTRISTYIETIQAVIDERANSKSIKGDIFLHLGTNVTECLIRAFLELSKSRLLCHQISGWSSITLVCHFVRAQIKKNDHDKIQLGFCIHILTEAMLKADLIHLRPKLLKLLREILSDAVSHLDEKILKQEVQPMMQRLIGACFQVHETCQKKFISQCKGRFEQSQRMQRLSCGLLSQGGNAREMDVWGWGTETIEEVTTHYAIRYGFTIESHIHESITGTFEVLKWIFENASALELNPQTFLSATPPYAISTADIKILENYDSRFSAQNLALSYVGRLGHGSDDLRPEMKCLVQDVKRRLESRHSWMNNTSKDILSNEINAGGESIGLLNMDQRMLYAELLQLERILRCNLKVGESDISSHAIASEFKSFIKDLSLICGASCPDELRVSASRCLGELSPAVIASISHSDHLEETTDWIGAACEKDVLLPTMQARCIECLGNCLKSSDPKVALVAAKTLEAIFVTKRGAECLKFVKTPAIKTLLVPFEKKKKLISKEYQSISERELHFLKEKADSPAKTNAWCWSGKLWECTEDSSFEDWICTLMPAIIDCCFEKSDDTDDTSVFFKRCQKMCLLEHTFSSTLFPCMILALLQRKNDKPESNPSNTCDINQLLSKAFMELMGENPRNNLAPNVKALTLLVDTLDLLFRVSHNKFLNSNRHSMNIKVLPDRTKKKRKSVAYNEILPPSTPWRGPSFGVMLQLDGLVVAKACIQARRFASALFFIDLHLNASFGKSGGVLEELSCESLSQKITEDYRAGVDISGSSKNPRENGRDWKASSLCIMTMIGTCFRGLHEYEELEALNTQKSALNFVTDGFGRFDDLSSAGGSLDTLRLLDKTSFGVTGEPTPLVVARCIEDLNMNQVLDTYIDGVFANYDNVKNLSSSDVQTLREKWYESHLRKRQWEHPQSLERGDSGSKLSSFSHDLPTFSKGMCGDYNHSGQQQGFFESLSRAVDSFLDDDMESCRSFLRQSRLSILDKMAEVGGEESSLLGTITVVDKLRALGDIESLTSEMKCVSDLLKRCGCDTEPSNGANHGLLSQTSIGMGSSDASEIDLLNFSSRTKELILRTLHFKKPKNLNLNQQDIFDCLVSHLWRTAAQARQVECPNLAEEAMGRLKNLLVSQTHNRHASDNILRIRFEEAKILECRGDFTSAIRRSREIAEHLIQRENSSEFHVEMGCLLADAQISCGSWMTKYKVQQANTVLETYLRPGAERAKRIYESDRVRENAERSTNASLELGQIVSNLYESLSSRIKSTEWQLSSERISQQASEIKRCQQLLESGAKQKTPSRSDELQDMEVYLYYLKRDFNRTKDERAKIEGSVLLYLNLAVQSFSTALAHASTSTKFDLSRYVCRMLSLWFTNHGDKRNENNIHDLMAMSIERIPSFRFVPLTNQLVSRIEKVYENEKFQSTLHSLIFKMCVEHPYHCIVHIVALFNGKKVGSGVSGRNANAFLENVGDSKVQAASQIMERLRKKGPQFIGKLLQNYKVVADAYIQLANVSTEKVQKTRTKKIKFSDVGSTLDKCLGRLSATAKYAPGVFTAPPPLSPGADYGNGQRDPIGGERIFGFEPYFDITDSGIHRPKVVICVGTKGSKFRQLVKGQDEIRQDAIMSQIFTYVNSLMRRRFAKAMASSNQPAGGCSVQHRLKMVTYHVIPLSPASGVRFINSVGQKRNFFCSHYLCLFLFSGFRMG